MGGGFFHHLVAFQNQCQLTQQMLLFPVISMPSSLPGVWKMRLISHNKFENVNIFTILSISSLNSGEADTDLISHAALKFSM